MARERTLGSAFTDMTALMAKAKDMVQLAEHFTRALHKGQGQGQGDSTASSSEVSEVEVMMLSMGRACHGVPFSAQLPAVTAVVAVVAMVLSLIPLKLLPLGYLEDAQVELKRGRCVRPCTWESQVR